MNVSQDKDLNVMAIGFKMEKGKERSMQLLNLLR